jgi:hypothetical protein
MLAAEMAGREGEIAQAVEDRPALRADPRSS